MLLIMVAVVTLLLCGILWKCKRPRPTHGTAKSTSDCSNNVLCNQSRLNYISEEPPKDDVSTKRYNTSSVLILVHSY